MKYCLLLLSGLIMLSACEKEKKEISNEDKLREGKWKIASWSVKFREQNGNEKTENVLEKLDECKKDDYLTFKTNYQGELNTGEKKCPQGEANEITFNWGLSNGDQNMYIYNAIAMFGIDVNAEVINFGSNSFSIRYMDIQKHSPLTLDTLTYTTTFAKF